MRYPDLAALNTQPVLLTAELQPRHKYIRNHFIFARAAWDKARD
jgi:hypothetical protein